MSRRLKMFLITAGAYLNLPDQNPIPHRPLDPSPSLQTILPEPHTSLPWPESGETLYFLDSVTNLMGPQCVETGHEPTPPRAQRACLRGSGGGSGAKSLHPPPLASPVSPGAPREQPTLLAVQQEVPPLGGFSLHTRSLSISFLVYPGGALQKQT